MTTKLAESIASHTPPDEQTWTLHTLERDGGDGAITFRIRAHGEQSFVEIARWKDGDRVASIGIRTDELDAVGAAIKRARELTLGAPAPGELLRRSEKNK